MPASNPITGEILNYAGINVDGNFTRAIKVERDDEVDPVSCWMDPKPDLRAAAIDPRRCEFGAGMMAQAWFGHMALDMLGAEAGGIDLIKPTLPPTCGKLIAARDGAYSWLAAQLYRQHLPHRCRVNEWQTN